MSITSTRSIAISFAGDQSFTVIDSRLSVVSTTSPAVEELKALTTGSNTITVPSAATTPTAVTIIPPAGNTNTLTLKGVTGDTGVVLHKTQASSIGLDTTQATLCITCAAPTNVRFIWT